jgi:hypothetical protein
MAKSEYMSRHFSAHDALIYEHVESAGGTKIVGTECERQRELRIADNYGPKDRKFRSVGYVGSANTPSDVINAIELDYKIFLGSVVY